MAFNPMEAVSSVVGATVGAIGANNAAKRQQAAANAQARMARSNFLTNALLQEPARSLGYQAYGDIANQFGYALPEYQTQNQLMAAMNPLTWKQVAKLVKQGMSFDQIAGMGTLTGITPKAIKRLTRAGLSMEQIQQLATRQSPQAAAPQGATRPAGSAFIDSPDYQFRRDEGTREIANSFAARGGAASGNALRELAKFNSGLAAGEFGNWFNRRMQLSGRGDQANANVGNAANTYNSNYAQAQQNLGDARASGILGVTGAIQGGLSGLAGSFGGGNSGGGGYGGYGNQPFGSGSWDVMNSQPSAGTEWLFGRI